MRILQHLFDTTTQHGDSPCLHVDMGQYQGGVNLFSQPRCNGLVEYAPPILIVQNIWHNITPNKVRVNFQGEIEKTGY